MNINDKVNIASSAIVGMSAMILVEYFGVTDAFVNLDISIASKYSRHAKELVESYPYLNRGLFDAIIGTAANYFANRILKI